MQTVLNPNAFLMENVLRYFLFASTVLEILLFSPNSRDQDV